jgi:hypothetical protein
MCNLVLVRLETVLASVQDGSTVCAERTKGSEIILDTPEVLLGDEAQVEGLLVCLQILLILTQDWSSACTERSTGSKIILDAPDGTLT